MKPIVALTILGLSIAAIAGWIMNVFAFIGMLSDNTITAMLVGRAIGIVVAPLGMLLGWF